ncbi:helix-turn-helix domain-containing protein [Actinokineospora inagensis]|uniref:helix-turn-helix domain-containing protein n=1 Tax=Actinokineospora inagensis TaxID=103730 RepID=UPI00040CF7CB|nr:helix-turn-helix transcriptional regulator [Actinokineospora inagensis]
MTTEDWGAVARAINHRMAILKITQEELVYRSGVSKTVIRELRHAFRRRRGTRTLEAISTALGFHPAHLNAIAHNRQPTVPHDLATLATLDPLTDNLRLLQHQLELAAHHIGNLTDFLDNLVGHVDSHPPHQQTQPSQADHITHIPDETTHLDGHPESTGRDRYTTCRPRTVEA